MSWWRNAVIYELYPRSFMDGNGDGVGDLAGALERVDYLAGLGVDAVWLTPIFQSPMRDMGYDVSDYCNIDPVFGTLQQFDALVGALHERGIRVILDLVPNHTSDEHPWFVESRSSRQSEKRDWYIWRDPGPDGGPPNNWKSVFGGSAWKFDTATTQYYYHAYLAQQPDLNWRNPAVEAAMHDVVRFWLRRGVDGFRVDVIWHLMKDDLFRDNPPNPDWREGMSDAFRYRYLYNTDRPEVHPTIARLRRVFDEVSAVDSRERLMIGEIYAPIDRLTAYYGKPDMPECHLPFNFSLVWPRFEWSASAIAERVDRYMRAVEGHGWPNWVLGNHDITRIATRVGQTQAKVAAVLLLSLQGTPTIYQGDELGLADVPIEAGRLTDGRAILQPDLGRDPVRTPMPWTSEAETGGFTSGRPWLPLNSDLQSRNVAALENDEDSILSLHRRLLALRRREPALSSGAMRDVRAEGDTLRFQREASEEGASRFDIALNLASKPAKIELPGAGVVAFSTSRAREGEPLGRDTTLGADEALIVRQLP